MTPKKTGVVVVLGAGGAKGLAHLGVLRALEEAHIPIDHFVGTSVGSMIAALYADYPHAAELAHYFMTLRRPDVIQYTLLNPTEGLVSNIHFQTFLTDHMHAKVFSGLKIPLWVVTTDFQTGESYLIGHGPIAPAVNASSAIAGVFQPVRLYGRYLIDGGYTDPIAVDVARKLHPKVVIAVNLTAPLSKRMPHNLVSLHLRAEGILYRHLLKCRSHHADIMIHPKLSDIVGIFDDQHNQALYLAGLKAGRQAIGAINQALSH